MTFDAVMFLTEAGRFITFNGACKVNFIFNSRFKKKINHSDRFFSEIGRGLLSPESLNTIV